VTDMGLVSGEDRDSMMGDINVTPLVDVMLVLLTIFIVTAPLLVGAIRVNLPRASTVPVSSEARSVRVSMTADGSVYVDRDRVSVGDLETALQMRGPVRGLTVEILADEHVPYGNVARLMVQVQRAGVTKFAFVMLPERLQDSPHSP